MGGPGARCPAARRGARLPADVQDWRAAVARLGEVGEVLLATTVHEARAFVPPAAAAGLPDSVAEGFRAAHFAEPGDRPVSGSAWERMTADMTEHQFASAARELASELRAAGIGVHVSRLDVEAGVDGAGAAHCLDVPFLFGDRSRWLDAPMLRGMSEEAFDAVAAAWRDPLVRAVAGEAAATGPGEVRAIGLAHGVVPAEVLPDARRRQARSAGRALSGGSTGDRTSISRS